MTGMDAREIDRWIARVVEAENAVIETACEQALLTGEFGVKVVRRSDGTLASVAPDPEVPYGEIHEHQQGCDAG